MNNFFQDLEKVLGTRRLKEDDNIFNVGKYNSKIVTNDISPGVFEDSEMNNTLYKLLKANVSIDIITMESRYLANNFLRFDEKLFFKRY